MIEGQTSIFEMLYPTYKITKPIRLIEFFAGYGSQALALKYLGVNFEHWKICEWAIKSIQAYKDIHFPNDNEDYSEIWDKEDLIEYLYNKGISSNWNEPMKESAIRRKSEEELRKIFNNCKATNNMINIQQVKGADLEIQDTDQYDYILTYSFPCQDLSLAGTRKLMSDTSTRSGMLWEVERILTECKELGQLPQVLLMENVPQVHGEGAIEDFNKWQFRLEELGYKNYWQDLIATDYGIPQTRNRCFMISILGDYNYTFPKPIKLDKKLKDMLEADVDDKYYLSEKAKEYICGNAVNKDLKDRIDRSKTYLSKEIAYTISTKQDRRNGDSNFILDGYGETSIGDYLKIKNANSKGYLEATDGDGVDISGRMQYHRGTVQKGKTQTLSTMGGENNGVVVKSRVVGGIGEKKSNNNTQWYQHDRIYEGNVAITITTECNPYYKNDLRIRKLTPRECFRLMGVKDEDFDKVVKNQSDSSLYHLAGDSIVVNVLMAIFKEMI